VTGSDDSPQPIQFSPAFRQLLQQSLARQSRSTAERIGIPGLVLEETIDPAGHDDDDGTGAFVWGAGARLARLLHRDPALRAQLRGRRVLELGCGTAVVSIAAVAAAGARLAVATDLPSRLAAARRNIAANGAAAGGRLLQQEGAAVRAAALDWGEGAEGVARLVDEFGGPFDWVLGADLTYEPGAMAPLARTMAAALRRRRGGGGGAAAAGSASVRPQALLMHRPRSREVDAAMAIAFEAEGLALVEATQHQEEEDEGPLTGRRSAAAAAAAAGEAEEEDEPLILYRVVGDDEIA